ncbi:electron transport complex subunit RsxE [candidate division TA06 bacterium]|jgi:electron transport complex protein RnfE|uniref:Ion-translocating oxidoreductase complex subunit E n=1 Tax=candidate division TA06 bacterium TaxID=2250710 RepID=A0A660SBX9_UNCT6|nr:MAG: electron transport complex subunit RsxE [candidate division TA06 bacterium]
MAKNSSARYLVNGIIKENPVLALVIGLCPTLAVSTSAYNALGMGIAVLFVLTLSNFTISLIRKLIPNEVRIPIFIIVISTFVTVIDYFMHAYIPVLYKNLGVFVPLIVVNCIILGRAEGFASKHNPWEAILDGIGSGLGFILAIFLIGSFREILGSGTFFGFPVFGHAFTKIPVLFFVLPPGGFLVIAFLMVLMNMYKQRREHA